MKNENDMWEAVINCDSSYNEKFIYAVKSTGIFCKPSCKSKAPTQANIMYFNTAEDAIRAGFRPCKRCRPDLADYQPILKIAEDVKCIIETYFEQRDSLMARLDNLGVSAHRLTEIFKDNYGMTPNQYTNLLKIERAKDLLLNGKDTVLTIGLSLGFDSLSSFYAFFRKHTQMSPKEYRDRIGGQGLAEHKRLAAYDTAFGKIVISSDNESITGVSFAEIIPTRLELNPSALMDNAAAQLAEYFSGQRQAFDLPINPIGTEFQCTIWNHLRTIPYGETRSYKQIAAAAGNPNASRAVGMANNKNPLMIFIPCHRVVGSQGELIGYAGGLNIKKRLLELERQYKQKMSC